LLCNEFVRVFPKEKHLGRCTSNEFVRACER